MNKEKMVFIKQLNVKKYPTDVPYNPPCHFPEYPFDEKTIDSTNMVYSEIRNLLYEMNLDKTNFNTKNWNPFKEFISPGDKVVLKPNMVMHKNLNRHYSTDCLITHGSIIRAVLDYVYIALKDNGKIIIADAPLQQCDFLEVIKKNGVSAIIDFYKSYGKTIELIDLRNEKAILDPSGRLIGIEKLKGDPKGYTVVDLGKDSSLYDIIDSYKKFRVTCYKPDIMKEHHNQEKNEYLIANTILEADVIINLPKAKTHKRAGITGAMKNLVGINGTKSWLPHHRKGSKYSGGDEYLNNNIFKDLEVTLEEQSHVAAIEGKKLKSFLVRTICKLFSVMRKMTFRDLISEGSWWGNDTVWRMVCDLNRIFIYADKKGVMRKNTQRKYIAFIDMLISGESEGPIAPSPNYSSILMSGYNFLMIDTVMATLMGFDFNKIPQIAKAYNLKEYAISEYSYKDIEIRSNNKIWLKAIDEIKLRDTLRFIPSSGWKSHIEID